MLSAATACCLLQVPRTVRAHGQPTLPATSHVVPATKARPSQSPHLPGTEAHAWRWTTVASSGKSVTALRSASPMHLPVIPACLVMAASSVRSVQSAPTLLVDWQTTPLAGHAMWVSGQTTLGPVAAQVSADTMAILVVGIAHSHSLFLQAFPALDGQEQISTPRKKLLIVWRFRHLNVSLHGITPPDAAGQGSHGMFAFVMMWCTCMLMRPCR